MSGLGVKIQAPPTAALQSVNAVTANAGTGASAKTGDAKKREDAAKAGREFEAILVRQMLAQTKIAGKSGGYGDMAVEALATSVTQAGGLGMGRAIEDALIGHGGHAAPAAASPPTTGTPSKTTPSVTPSTAIDLKKPAITYSQKK